MAHALEADRWLYVTSGLGLGARKYSLAADQTLYVGDQHIFKSDLSLTAPDDEGQVDSATPTLAWEPYADAAYYEVYLAPENGGPLFVNKRVDDSQIALDTGIPFPRSAGIPIPARIPPWNRDSRPTLWIPRLRFGF